MSTSLSSYYVLSGNIDCSATSGWNGGAGFVPVGNNSVNFSGNFNGQGYTISGLYINNPGLSFAGLFGLTSSATIENFSLAGADIIGSQNVGAAIGYQEGGTTSNVQVIGGSVAGSASNVGGFVGQTYSSPTISNSSSSAKVTDSGSSKTDIGGFVGVASAGSYSGDAAYGAVSGGGNTYVGGFAGEIMNSTLVTNDFATGNVSSSGNTIGGFAGELYNQTASKIYATGNVSSPSGVSVSGLVGFGQGNITLSQAYATGTVTGSEYCGGIWGQYNWYGTINIQDTYSTSNINCSSFSGGLVGWMVDSGINITDSYSIGSVPNSASNNGFAGKSGGVTTSQSFWNTTTSGQTTGISVYSSYSNTGAPTGLTTSALQSVATYTETSLGYVTTAWDFVGNPYNDTGNNNYWTIDGVHNGGYPYFPWQTFNASPGLPSSLGNSGAVSGAWSTNTQPTLTASLSDPNSGSTVAYEVQISTHSDFSSPVVDYVSGFAVPSNVSFSVGQAPGSGYYAAGSAGQTLGNGQYYWRIEATDSSYTLSGWEDANSGAAAFGVDTSAPSVPGTPSTTSPTTSTSPTWSWAASTDSGSGLATMPYTIQLSQNSSFASGVTDAITGVNYYTPPSPLALGTWYARVKAVDALGNASAYSPADSVSIIAPVVQASSPAGSVSGSGSSLQNAAVQTSSQPGLTTGSTPGSTPGASLPAPLVLNNYTAYTSGAGETLSLPAGDVIYFYVGSQKHSVTIDKIGEDAVVITLRSTTQTATLHTGQVGQYDVKGDGQPDISIKLESVQGGVAQMSFAQIKPAPSVQVALANHPNASDSHWQWFVLGGLVGLCVGGWLVRRRRKTV